MLKEGQIMNRRRWAILIVSSLLITSAIILVFRSSEWVAVPGSGQWEETVVSAGQGQTRVAQLFVEGPITNSAGLFSSGFLAGDFISQLNQVKEDPTIKGLVIRVNSPGGSVVVSDDMHNKIVDVQQAGKKVVISMGEVAASGGYYIAAPADYIFASPLTITGSLGVIFSIPNYQEAAQKIGYYEETITSGNYKDIGNPLRPMKESEKDIYRSLVDEAYARFVEVIATGRDMSKSDVMKIADGRVYSGRQAKDLGLIDAFGTLEAATAYTQEAVGTPDAQVIRYTAPFTFASLLTSVRQQQPSLVSEALIKAFPELFVESGLLYLFRP